MKKTKRKECYILKPSLYDIECNICHGFNITWSEFDKLIWCYDCKKDVPGTNGILDGPVPVEVCKLLGVSFDKIDLKTNEILKFKIEDGKITYIKSGKFI